MNTLICKSVDIIGIIILLSATCYAQKIHNRGGVVSVSEKEIHFTVLINLKFPEENSHKLEVADNDSAYYDQAVLKLPKDYSDDGAPVRVHGHGIGFPY